MNDMEKEERLKDVISGYIPEYVENINFHELIARRLQGIQLIPDAKLLELLPKFCDNCKVIECIKKIT